MASGVIKKYTDAGTLWSTANGSLLRYWMNENVCCLYLYLKQVDIVNPTQSFVNQPLATLPFKTLVNDYLNTLCTTDNKNTIGCVLQYSGYDNTVYFQRKYIDWSGISGDIIRTTMTLPI